jgi:uncharacterized membrane-anchored protein YitT (DUF2179 family)
MSIHTVLEPGQQKPFESARRILLICFGAFLMAVNLNTFVRSGQLIPGGFTGFTRLMQQIIWRYLQIDIPFSPIYYLCNIVPAIISFKYIGKKFTLLSGLMILLSGFFTDFLPKDQITHDILLSAVFGGILNATAISICLFAGATSGGTDFIAIFISEKYSKDAWNYILYGNMGMLAVSGVLFGWDSALYSILFQFTSTQLLNHLYHRYQKVTLFVITNKAEDLYKIIESMTHHGATIFHGEGCYKKEERDLLYSVVSGDDVQKLLPAIRNTDPGAFINFVSSTQILGKFYRKPND